MSCQGGTRGAWPVQNNRRPRGRPPKLGEYHAFVLRLPEELYKSLQDKAHEYEVSLNDILVRIAREWLEKEKN